MDPLLPKGRTPHVCVLFTLNRPLHPLTTSTTSARADASILERYKLWSQNYATQILLAVDCYWYAVKQSRQCNARSRRETAVDESRKEMADRVERHQAD